MILAKLITNEDERLNITNEHFGIHYPFNIEPYIYKIASDLSKDYNGGFWKFFSLSNEGFFQTPSNNQYNIICPNDFETAVTSYEFGIIVCLYTFSTLSFKPELQDSMTKHFHTLREYALDIPNNKKIFQAID